MQKVHKRLRNSISQENCHRLMVIHYLVSGAFKQIFLRSLFTIPSLYSFSIGYVSY